jgi:hypothetical protein
MAINLRIFLPGYLLLGVLCLVGAGVAAAQPLEMLLPVESPGGAVAMQKSSEEAKPYIKRVGQVRLAAARMLPPRAVANQREAVKVPQRGSTMSLAFFPGEVFTIEVDGQEQPQQGVLSINGRVAGAAMSTFSMTVTKEGYLITLQDLAAGKLYRVVGEQNSDLGRVVEYDLDEMPARIFSPPRIPPAE